MWLVRTVSVDGEGACYAGSSLLSHCWMVPTCESREYAWRTTDRSDAEAVAKAMRILGLQDAGVEWVESETRECPLLGSGGTQEPVSPDPTSTRIHDAALGGPGRIDAVG